MDKGLTHFMRGRVRLAVLLVVCMVAIVALPALAHAATFSSEYPIGVTVHGQPAVVSVDVAGAVLDAKSGVITDNGFAYPAFVDQTAASSAAGSWSASESLVGGVYKTTWKWNIVAGAATLSVYPSALAVGATSTVTATVKDTAKNVLTDPTTWAFSVAATSVPLPGTSASVYNNAICTTSCHLVGGSAIGVTGNHAKNYVTDIAMGANCYSCHHGAFTPLHGLPTSALMAGNHLTVQSEIVANSAGCVSCHGSDLLAVATKNANGSYTVPAVGGATEHIGCSCHVYHETSGKMACEGCHANPMVAGGAYPYHVGAHDDLQAGMSGTKSSACVACHGFDLLHVAAGPMTQGAHLNCVCHAQGVATSATTECASCHTAGDAAHGFVNGVNHGGGGYVAASGHNTDTYGSIGAKTKFDGSQGATLTWTATQDFSVTTSKAAAAMSVAPGTSFTTGQTGTVTSNWDFPTTSVFWPAEDSTDATIAQAAPATAMRGLTSKSVITCQDCHTGLNAAGPHGAAQNWSLDANFSADYSMAGLTKKVTGTGSVGGNGLLDAAWTGYSTSGIYEAAPATSGSTPASRFAYQAGWTSGNNVICAKCHRLETAFRAATALEGTNTLGTSGLSYPSVEGANTAHDNHHQDTTDGTAQCVSCHVAIPHGWKAPRLLVDVLKYEGTPYVSENAIEDMGTLAALNNHPVIASTGFLPYSISSGTANAVGSDYNIAHVGTVLWDESQCDACGDHYGADGNRGLTTTSTPAAGSTYGNGSAVPVRIN